MKPNGYQYAYDKPTACEKCDRIQRAGGIGKQYRLFEAHGEKWCITCAKQGAII